MTGDPANRYRDPAVRNYLFAALAALLVVAAAMFVRGGLPAAVMPVCFALLGLFTRWAGMPRVFLVVLCYFIILPLGFPLLGGAASGSAIPGSHFQMMDVILAGAVIVYFACQYRLTSLTQQGMPFDVPPAQRPKDAQPPRRPASIVADDEMGRLFLAAGLCVLLGQFVWLVVTEFRPALGRVPPFTTTGLDYTDVGNRFLMLGVLAAVVGLAAGLSFWYWRLARLSAAEARMMLLDVQWFESRRELNRQEKWRAWGRARSRPRPAKRRKRRSFLEAAALTFVILIVALLVAVLASVVIMWLQHRPGRGG
jgi:hypothetical protein